MNDYFNEILFWVGTCISAVAGTGVTIGTLIKVVNNAINSLKSGKTDYDSSVNKINELSDKLISASETIQSVSSELESTRQQLIESKDSYEQIKKVLYLLANNNKEYVVSGTSDEINKILGFVDEGVCKVEENE